jgi:hypothetical protein
MNTASLSRNFGEVRARETGEGSDLVEVLGVPNAGIMIRVVFSR